MAQVTFVLFTGIAVTYHPFLRRKRSPQFRVMGGAHSGIFIPGGLFPPTQTSFFFSTVCFFA